MNTEEVDLLKTEAELLRSMDHPNIVKFKHVRSCFLFIQIREVGGKIFLGMELLTGGMLSKLIESYR